MTTIPKAYIGYNPSTRAYVPYTGNMTNDKENQIRQVLREAGFAPGWKTKNVRIEPADASGFSLYREDGAGGNCKVVVLASV